MLKSIDSTCPLNCSIVTNLSFWSRRDVIIAIGVLKTNGEKKSVSYRSSLENRSERFTIIKNEIRFPNQMTWHLNKFDTSEIFRRPNETVIVPFLSTSQKEDQKWENSIQSSFYMKNINVCLHNLIFFVLNLKKRKKHNEKSNRKRFFQLTTSAIWINLRPNLTLTISELFFTGRTYLLYFLIKNWYKRSMWWLWS